MNETVFAAFSSRLGDLDWGWGFAMSLPAWRCECSEVDCVERVELSSVEYQAVREHASRFFVAPTDAHVRRDVERVIGHTDNYWLVEETIFGDDVPLGGESRHSGP